MAYAKLLIKGNIEILTGLHIGGQDSYSAIGAVDSPVVRDTVSGEPIIPGSSLKGKMRCLLQKNLWRKQKPRQGRSPSATTFWHI